jgi:hypothetical protein
MKVLASFDNDSSHPYMLNFDHRCCRECDDNAGSVTSGAGGVSPAWYWLKLSQISKSLNHVDFDTRDRRNGE